MDAPTAVIAAAAFGLALKCLADLADRQLSAERARVRREAPKAEVRPDLGFGGGEESPAAVPPA